MKCLSLNQANVPTWKVSTNSSDDFAHKAGTKIASVFPASMGQLEAEKAALTAEISQQDAKISQQDTIINNLVVAVKKLTAVSSYNSCARSRSIFVF